MTKSQLRAEYLARRRDMPSHLWQEYSGRIAHRLLDLPEIQSASRILTYIPGADNEVDTLPLIREFLCNGRTIGVPRALPDGTLVWHTLASLEILKPGRFGIPEPDPATAPLFESPQTAECCLVPGIAWDSCGNRIGYGKGYFDRFLSSYCGVTIGMAFEQQLIDEAPTEPHDRPVQMIVTESGVRRIPPG